MFSERSYKRPSGNHLRRFFVLEPKVKRNQVIGLVLAVLAVASFGLFLCVPATPVPVGAGESSVGTMIPWSAIEALLAMLTGGTTIGSILAFFVKLLHPATPAPVVPPNQTTVVTDPTTIKTLPADQDVLEFVQAAINYAGHRNDQSAQYRFVIAAMAEVRDILSQFPLIAPTLNAVMTAIVNAYFPQTPVDPAPTK